MQLSGQTGKMCQSNHITGRRARGKDRDEDKRQKKTEQ